MDEQSKTVLYEGRFLRLAAAGHWEFAERTCAEGIVVVAAEYQGGIILVEQFRPPVDARVIELPAGLAGDSGESSGESLLSAAERELLEETGFHASDWEEMFTGPISPGMTTEILTFFRARGLTKSEVGGGVEGEQITVHDVPLRSVRAWLREQVVDGAMVDPKVYLGIFLLEQAHTYSVADG